MPRYNLPAPIQATLADILFYLTEDDTWYDHFITTAQKIKDYLDNYGDAPEGMPASHYLIQQHLKEMGLADKQTVEDVTTPLNAFKQAFLPDL